MSLKWWEKTVEYLFVMEVAQAQKLFIAPLDGTHEQAGDTIFSSSNKWLLIEFKINSDAISSEEGKFTNYEKAKQALKDLDAQGGHYIIYGELDSAKKLQLKIQTYFSAEGVDDVKGLLKKGAELEFFIDYLNCFLHCKKGKGTAGTGSLGFDDYSFVAGINNDEEMVSCLSLTDFNAQLKPACKRDSKLEQNTEHGIEPTLKPS